MMPFAYFRREIVPSHQACISIASNSLQYGTTCFGGVRGYVKGGVVKVFRLKDHYVRLMNASKIMGMKFHLPFEEFEKAIGDLIEKNAPASDFYVRPFLFSESQQLAPKGKGLIFDLAVYMVPLGNYFDPSKGMKLMISSWRKFSDSALPTKAKAGGCYVNSFLATNEANERGFDEALLTDDAGNIIEASVANILLVHRGRILSPQVGGALLEGITLRTAVELLGGQVHFESIGRSLVYTADELILMGTAAQFSFAASVDGRVISEAPGPVCRFLRSRFDEVLNSEHEWVTLFKGGDV